ncbi:unnamed protein product [Arctia plantaginis]|uniref:Uncharacterized protein n=1 Tax=Arctia plantaginis TaxID=874455 RepID=A0A8S1BAQ6_ARCPL|nr:unnamed protein product [Arctia plantaginis]
MLVKASKRRHHVTNKPNEFPFGGDPDKKDLPHRECLLKQVNDVITSQISQMNSLLEVIQIRRIFRIVNAC